MESSHLGLFLVNQPKGERCDFRTLTHTDAAQAVFYVLTLHHSMYALSKTLGPNMWVVTPLANLYIQKYLH